MMDVTKIKGWHMMWTRDRGAHEIPLVELHPHVRPGLVGAGLAEAKPGETDAVAMNLLDKLSAKSRQRWPVDLFPDDATAPGLVPVVSS